MRQYIKIRFSSGSPYVICLFWQIFFGIVTILFGNFDYRPIRGAITHVRKGTNYANRHREMV